MTMPTSTKVQKRDGRLVLFSKDNIATALQKASEATGDFNNQEAERLAGIVEGIVAQVAKALGPKTPISVEQIQDTVEQVLMAAGQFRTAKAYILYRAERADIRKTEQQIGIVNDLNLSLNQLKVIEKRYLRHDEQGKAIESPAQMFRRVAVTLAGVEKKKQSEWEEKFYEIMTRFEFLPAGRTLNNAGTPQNQLANCFVLPVEDSMEGIFDAVKWMALVHQRGGGTGFDFTPLRPRGDVVSKSSGGFSTGPVSFMKVFDVATRQVMQGGKLRGANMGILGVSHPDILEFISCKNEDGEISNFNISVGATDEFMRAVKQDKPFALRNPRNNEIVQEISARLLMDHVVSLAWRTGDPGMIFWDEINRNNPLRDSVGEIRATNPCGEQPLHPFDACNLGSLNLSQFVLHPMNWVSHAVGRENGKPQPEIDWARLHTVTKIAVRMLDNVVDACSYPLPQIDHTVKQNRRIGLGVMGWADMLIKLGVSYASPEAEKLARKVMAAVQVASWEASAELAKEKGVFPRWKESLFAKGWDPVKQKKCLTNPLKVRNVAITTIAPTGTISMVAETSSGIEPVFALSYVKNVVDEGGLVYLHPLFETALREALPSQSAYNEVIAEVGKVGSVGHSERVPKALREVFVTSHEIPWQSHVGVQAAFQAHTDNAVSKTINFASTATIEEIREAYMLAWEKGCKGITVYRDSSKAGQVLSAGSDSTNTQSKQKKTNPTKDLQIIQSKLKATPLHQRTDFDLLTQVELQKVGMKTTVKQSIKKDDLAQCPECGAELQLQEGCNLCLSCGWSKCSL